MPYRGSRGQMVAGGLLHDYEKGIRGGLAVCRVCGAAEGQLLSWCPGFKLTYEAMEACYQGNVVDLEGYRRFLRYRKAGSR